MCICLYPLFVHDISCASLDRGTWHNTLVVSGDAEELHATWPRELHHIRVNGIDTEVYTARKPRRVMDAHRRDDAVLNWRQSLVLHVGAAYIVEVPTYAPHTAPYDGGSDAVINMGRWLFTYEYLQTFLTQLMFGTATFRGYLHHSLLMYKFACDASVGDDAVRVQVDTLLNDLNRGSFDHGHKTGTQRVYKAFLGAVMDYIQLQVRSCACCLACTDSRLAFTSHVRRTHALCPVPWQHVDYENTMGCVCPPGANRLYGLDVLMYQPLPCFLCCTHQHVSIAFDTPGVCVRCLTRAGPSASRRVRQGGVGGGATDVESSLVCHDTPGEGCIAVQWSHDTKGVDRAYQLCHDT